MPNVSIHQNQLSLSYELDGPEQAPTLILLHGFCGSKAYWRQIKPLLTNDYRVLIPDIRGHGQSGNLDGDRDITIEELAEDIVLLLDALQIEKACLYGHSMGGYLTLALAENAPERLQGWGLIHSTALPDSSEAKQNRERAIHTIQSTGIEPFVDGLVPKLFAPQHQTTMSSHIEAMKQVGYCTSSIGAINASKAMRDRINRVHIIERSQSPVLLVAGAQDQIIPPERVHTATGEHITSHTIDDCGHMGMIEQPQLIANLIRKHVEPITH